MSVGISERRTLELTIRSALAEERVFQRRLDRLAGEQHRARLAIEQEMRREHSGRLPDGWSSPD